MRRVLVVDDEAEIRSWLEEELGALGFEVEGASGAEEALEVVGRDGADVVLTDLRMKGRSGTELCREVVGLRPDLPVLVMTAFGSMEAAMAAIRAGAYDFLTKPFELEQLVVALERALERAALHQEVVRLRRVTGDAPGFEGLVGTSAPMQRLYDLIERVARSEASILVSGESGTGKELVARALHQRSRRSQGPFVPLNCAALPEALLESELFGHVKGAFTDARSERKGLLREAEGGTVFLDEVGDLSAALQPKLLRALQERRVRPVGGDREVAFDARVVAATHRPLKEAVESGAFRADLFYRLAVITIDVPSLRARGDDVPLLAEQFLEQLARRDGRPVPELSEAVVRRLRGGAWPGNVRELQNCMERCLALCGDVVEVEHLPPELSGVEGDEEGEEERGEGWPTLFEVERRHILRVVEAVSGNKSRAARVLGIDRKTLHARLARYGRS